MPGLLNSSSVLMCPHGGSVSAITTNSRSKAAGDFLLRASDTFIVGGCPLNVAGAPHPCVKVQWSVADEQSKAVGDSTLSEESVGLCVAADQAVQGTVLINFTQPRVSGR